MPRKAQLDLVAALLSGGVRGRHQDPKIEVRRGIARPFYFIRPYVPIKTETGILRKQVVVQLGRLDSMTLKQARIAKEEYMATLNAGKTVLQCQVPFERMLKKFEEGALPLLAPSTRGKYNGYLGRIRDAFGKKQMFEVDTQSIQALVNGATTLGWWAKQDLRNCLSAVFTDAKQIGLWSEANPCEGVKVGRKSTVREKKIPSADGLSQFVAALKDTKICTAHEARLIVLTAVVSSLRVSEVLGQQPRDMTPTRSPSR